MIAKPKNKVNKTASELRRQKKLRRKMATFIRMCRYGVNNFSRNAWLSIAATAVMTITLLIIFTTLVARGVLLSTVDSLRQKVSVSVYLKSDVSSDQVQQLKKDLKNESQVAKVNYISTDDARKTYIKENKTSADQLDAIAELPKSTFPATLRVTPRDLNKMNKIEALVTQSSDFQAALDPAHKPSFAGERRQSIDSIGRSVHVAERVGLAASVIFISISVLIIFNTIRMAIFNRREEIEMMKLIGAEKSFIQGPFVVEAVMYGFFAAILAFIIGVGGFISLQPRLENYGLSVGSVYDIVVTGSPFIVIGLIIVGALIGVLSSFFAVRRHLKI